MRALTMRAAASLLVTASLTFAAQASELLVMPYACAMIGGRPLLSPAREQSHRVIGQREQRNFTACSPVNPDMCRSWTVHRFDLDCEGTRVPWISLVAAAAEQDRGMWVEDGRLRLRMGPRWSFAPDDPCARGPGYDDGFGFGRMRRYCADRRAMTPPPIVDMPVGFAPMLRIDGFFVNAAGPGIATAPSSPPPVAEAPAPPPRVARIEPPQAQRPVPAPAPPARAEPPDAPVARDLPVRDTPFKVAPPAPAPQAAIQPPAPPVAPPPPPVQITKAPPAAPAPQATPPAASGGPVIPKIINRPEAAPAAPPPVTVVSKAPSSEPATSQPAASREVGSPPLGTTPENADPSITVNLLGAVRSPAVSVVAAFAGLALVLLAGFAMARRRDRLRHAGMRPRDFASASLDGRQQRGSLVPRPAGGRANPHPPAPRGPAPPAPAAYAMGNTMPQTRAEALQVLGMGVSPAANETAMKKIVDGLRLSWHPDLAQDEHDRQLRELRMKQINAAWELIQGKRVEA